ncbi:MAG TPA: Ppx/GppA phosphatase family protein [Polyangiaceae bacterium]|nr:Ppx/GppA phosphatase family protein [Polyangiaceae bacterium]
MTRLASIDVGTNSVLLTIADHVAGVLTPVLERATVTRLGQEVDRTGRLHPDACARTWACLSAYREQMTAAGVTALAAVGTSALRDVEEGRTFLARAEEILGQPLEVISGEREAELTFGGALSGLSVSEGESLFVFDIGGGSTELVWGRLAADASGRLRPRIERATSLQLGSVRLHERFRLGDPVEPAALEALGAQVRDALRAYDSAPSGAQRVVGVAGTVTTLAALALGLERYDGAIVHGATFERADVWALAQRLAGLPLAERIGLAGLDPGRADVIVSGARLCAELLDWLGASSLQASDRGVRYGLLEELSARVG